MNRSDREMLAELFDWAMDGAPLTTPEERAADDWADLRRNALEDEIQCQGCSEEIPLGRYCQGCSESIVAGM